MAGDAAIAAEAKTWPLSREFGKSDGMTHGGFRTALRACARTAGLAFVALALTATACRGSGASLSKSDEDDSKIPNFPPPPENGPKLGVIANLASVLERPTKNARAIGTLHAGAFVTRSKDPVRKTADCEAGYYAIYPRGFVCLNQGFTLELSHPTLVAMSIQPALDQALPYTYGRTRVASALYERDPNKERTVREVQKLPRGSAMAIVGSWSASLADAEPERLGLSTSGRFVRAEDLEAVQGSSFSGYTIDEQHPLPVAFVVKRGVSWFEAVDDDRLKKREPLEYHETLPLSGHYRTMGATKFWGSSDNERWFRERDVTIVYRKLRMPDFARDGQRWIDIGVLLGTLVLYEGQRPIFTTLVSTGRVRPGDVAQVVDDGAPAMTKLGTFEVLAKHVTLLGAAPERAGERYAIFDLPWALELSSGQLLFGAYWHDRFGIEHGPGDIMLSPQDAHRVFQWVTPALPKGWHSATSDGKDKTIVLVHK